MCGRHARRKRCANTMALALRAIGEWLKTFSAVVCALLLVLAVQSKADAPAGNGSPGIAVTSPNVTICPGGTSFNVTLDLCATQPIALAWSAAQTFNSTIENPASGVTACNATGGPTGYGVCVNGQGLIVGLLTQPTGCTGGTTIWNATSACSTVNSAAITFCRSSATVSCQADIDLTSGGVLELKPSSSITTNGKNLSVTTGNVTASRLLSNSACSGTTPISPAVDCLVATVTGASSTAVWNFHSAYATAPACHAQDQTTATALKVITTTSAVTVTGLAGATDSVVIGCEN